VTADEIPDPQNLQIATRLNNVTMQDANTKDMIFNVAQIISYVSNLVDLKPGDVIASGTPSGVGFSRDPQVFMNTGDVCEIEIERVGILRNIVTEG
jgi:2-keto-4-pentenoate hydratase/2-oxohepta-3-ene-1,7-dioic acid hydratase in catechol pathway